MTDGRTARGLLGECLLAAGVERVFTAPVAGVSVPGPAKVVEGNPVLAALAADADGRIGPGPGASLSESMVLRVSSRPGGSSEPLVVTSPADLPDAVATAAGAAADVLPGTGVLRLDLDLDAPVADGLGPAPVRRADPGPLPAIPLVARTLVLAGPGVLRAGAVAGLRAFADRAGFAVANTWGAKGVFPWDSVHHMGTVGLQARDFALLGFGDVDLIVTTGLDPDEAPASAWRLGPPSVDVHPAHLATLAERWDRPRATIRPNDFLTRMTACCAPLREDGRFPLSPGRAVGDLRALLTGHDPANPDTVAADPGPAGLWVARAFPTTAMGSIVVPSSAPQGFAAAAGLAAGARSPRRRCVAVTAAPVDPLTLVALDAARRLGVALTLCVWGDPGRAGVEGPGVVVVESLAGHAAAVGEALGRRAVRVVCVPVDWTDTRRLVEVAGPVVAWPGVPCGG